MFKVYTGRVFEGKLIHQKSRIRETTNLSTDADRHTDTERNIKNKSSPLDLVRCGGGCCALYSRAFVYIVIHWTNLHLFPMQCTSLQSKIKYIYIHSFNAQQFNSLDCIELHCLANCWFAVHCNVLDCTAPPTLHYTALHLVKFEILCYYKNLYNIIALLL